MSSLIVAYTLGFVSAQLLNLYLAGYLYECIEFIPYSMKERLQVWFLVKSLKNSGKNTITYLEDLGYTTNESELVVSIITKE